MFPPLASPSEQLEVAYSVLYLNSWKKTIYFHHQQNSSYLGFSEVSPGCSLAVDSPVSNKQDISYHVKHGWGFICWRGGGVVCSRFPPVEKNKKRSFKQGLGSTCTSCNRSHPSRKTHTIIYAINLLFTVAWRYFRWNGDTLKMFILS